MNRCHEDGGVKGGDTETRESNLTNLDIRLP